MSHLAIYGKDIQRLVTKFHYDGADICFEIMLRIKENAQLVLFLKTKDYGTFRKAFDDLMTLRSENGIVNVPPTVSDDFYQKSMNAA